MLDFFVAQNVGELWRTDFLRCCCRALNLQLYSNSRASSVQGRVAYPKGTFLRFHLEIPFVLQKVPFGYLCRRPATWRCDIENNRSQVQLSLLVHKGTLFLAGEVANW